MKSFVLGLAAACLLLPSVALATGRQEIAEDGIMQTNIVLMGQYKTDATEAKASAVLARDGNGGSPVHSVAAHHYAALNVILAMGYSAGEANAYLLQGDTAKSQANGWFNSGELNLADGETWRTSALALVAIADTARNAQPMSWSALLTACEDANYDLEWAKAFYHGADSDYGNAMSYYLFAVAHWENGVTAAVEDLP